MTFDELYKKVINASKAFEERQVPISLDFKIEDLCDALVESNVTIEKLKQKLEDAKATAYTESVDAGMENRKLKRALWLARASEASKEVNYWNCENESSYAIVDFNVHHETIVSYKAPHHRPYKWILIWEEVERKCRAKAEEYK